LRTGAAQRALVIGAETMTRLMDWTDRGTGVLFGDGAGAADNDRPYQFGHPSTAVWPYPFSIMQFARLLIVRGRVRAAKEYVDATHGVS